MWRHIKQANFTSHHTRDHHIGFLFTRSGIGKYNKCPRTFYLVLTTIPNYNWVTRISAHTFCWNFNSFHEVKFKCVLLIFSIPHHTKRKPSGVAESCAYRCVPRRTNLLLKMSNALCVLRPECAYCFWSHRLIHFFTGMTGWNSLILLMLSGFWKSVYWYFFTNIRNDFVFLVYEFG